MFNYFVSYVLCYALSVDIEQAQFAQVNHMQCEIDL